MNQNEESVRSKNQRRHENSLLEAKVGKLSGTAKVTGGLIAATAYTLIIPTVFNLEDKSYLVGLALGAMSIPGYMRFMRSSMNQIKESEELIESYNGKLKKYD